MSSHDVVIVGSSPNALACAARLSRGGGRVLVLEPADTLGGPVTSEELLPGVQVDPALPGLTLDAEVARELSIEAAAVRRETVTVLGGGGSAQRVSSSSAAAGGVAIEGMQRGALLPHVARQAVTFLQAAVRAEAPDLPAPSGPDLESLRGLGRALVGLGPRDMREVLRLLFLPARDFAREAGLSEAQSTAVCAGAVHALPTGPFAAGTLYNHLLHEALGDGLFGPAVRGGQGALVARLAARARELGVEIRSGAGAVTVEIEGGAARGVRVADEVIAAGAVVSDLDVQRTFTRLVAPYHLPPEVNRAVRNLRCRGTVARIHLALSEMPRFAGADAEALRGVLLVAADVASIERAWDQAKRGRLPERPLLAITAPAVADPDLATGGREVLSITVEHVPYTMADREHLLRVVMGLLAEVAPDLGGRVLARRALLPGDIESRFGLTGGHLYGGESGLSRSFFLRGVPGCRPFETPIEGLHLCGSAVHPGGYGGTSGLLLAGKLLA